MIVRFRTESGSVYDLEFLGGDPDDGGRVRRLEGVAPPTPRQGPDRRWRSFVSASPPKVGRSVVIVWRRRTDGSGTDETTVTSRVVSLGSISEAPDDAADIV